MGFLDKALQKMAKALDEEVKKRNSQSSGGDAPAVPSPSAISKHTSSEGSISLTSSLTMSEVMHFSSTATRWEKAVVATDSVIKQVVKFDPDGVDVVCVGGESLDTESDGIEWHRNITDSEGIEATIATVDPGGPCPLGQAMDQVLKEALGKDLKETPCSVLVLTAGRPDDSELLEEALTSAAQEVADRGGVKEAPLSVSLIQIGDDADATEYLEYLDKKMVGVCDETGDKIDIVDTMGYPELKETVDAIEEHSKKIEKEKKQAGTTGAILGAVAGAAMGIGGMYLAGKAKASKRVKSGSWAGKWKCFYETEEVATLDVADDGQGNLIIEGLEDTLEGTYLHDGENGAAVDSEDFFIKFNEPHGETVVGTFDAENYVLHWSDGTRWEVVNKTHWAAFLGAATAGAAAAGATGYVLNRKFFRKVGDKEECDYVLVIDRSIKMEVTDLRTKTKA